ncbi:MAG: Ldh family oxidoreductase [Pararhodobacter sp.]|nr:Ldh family oxidoreductase [Pararhodobacter sp.]
MTTDPENQSRFHRGELLDWTGKMLVWAGVDAEDAELAAEGLVRADARGFKTHGLARLPNYLEKFASGALTAGAEPGIQRNGAFIRYDAGNTLGQICGPRAVEAAIALAQQQPVAVCQLVNAGHLGALGINLLPAAEAGMVALMFQATPPIIGIPGARAPLIGNNPLAMAAPRANGPPILVDFACCVAARGNILLAARDGTPIPEGWALDREGQGTTDPHEALLGALLPFGGHKGIALAMIVEILAGSLAGGEFQSSLNQGQTVNSGVGGLSALILVLNPAAMQGRAAYEAHVEAWTTHYLTEGGDAARIPGHRAHLDELQADRQGVPLLPAIVSELIEAGRDARLPFPEPVSQN